MIDGLGIHFLHARSSDPDALPLVLTHGWPGSVVEFRDVVEPLNDAGFHCVVPSLPGYGWSDKPAVAGWGIDRIARAWATLMARLGYDRYGAQGSDWGTSISASLGQQDKNHIVGVHLMPPLAPPDPATLGALTDHEQEALDAMKQARRKTPATPRCTAHVPRRSATRWLTRPPVWPHGSSRNSGPGLIHAANFQPKRCSSTTIGI